MAELGSAFDASVEIILDHLLFASNWQNKEA